MSRRLTKEERKARTQAWAEEQRRVMVRQLPVDLEQLEALVRFVDERVVEGCWHDLRAVEEWLDTRPGLPDEALLAWLRDHGGYCDCEVAANIPDTVEACRVKLAVVGRTRRPRGPKVPAAPYEPAPGAPALPKVPRPWKWSSQRDPDGPTLQLGKRGRCKAVIVPSAITGPREDRAWIKRWEARTDLPARDARVERRSGSLGGVTAEILTVWCEHWVPVLAWVEVPGRPFHLRVSMEMAAMPSHQAALDELMAALVL